MASNWFLCWSFPSPPPPPSSSSSTPNFKYDVFLSFREDDTRNNFTSHLHKALCDEKIVTFIDDKLDRGDEISPSLLKAIEESRIFVVIFSKDYASSRWCLEELVEILECRKKYYQIVMPVFYGVEPTHIRNQTGDFAVAFADHEQRFKDKVQEWKDALRKAADLDTIKLESALIEKIVEDILKRLNDVYRSRYDRNLESTTSSMASNWFLCWSFPASPPPPPPPPPSSSSSSSSTPKFKYDVFLSFRGNDTRNNFTSHLQKALRDQKIETFIDDKLKRGDEISPSLLKAIEESRISVVIFSKGYASSRWCLEELVKIIECREKYKQIVIPVFYGVEPTHIRNQTGDLAEAFADHEQRFEDKVQAWKDALREAADLDTINPESALIEKIVEDILKRLKVYRSSHDRNLGINELGGNIIDLISVTLGDGGD